MSVPYSHSYCQYSSPPLCCVNQTCKNYMTNSFTRKFPLFICHLSRFVQKKRFQATGLRALCIWNQMKGEAGKSEKNKKKQKNNNTTKCRTLFPHWAKNNYPYHSAASEGAQSVYSPPYPAQGISVCVHKYWAVRWKRVPLHSGMGVPTLNAWVTDYFLTSWTSTLYKEEP